MKSVRKEMQKVGIEQVIIFYWTPSITSVLERPSWKKWSDRSRKYRSRVRGSDLFVFHLASLFKYLQEKDTHKTRKKTGYSFPLAITFLNTLSLSLVWFKLLSFSNRVAFNISREVLLCMMGGAGPMQAPLKDYVRSTFVILWLRYEAIFTWTNTWNLYKHPQERWKI